MMISMDNLDSVIKFCNDRIDVNKIKDFPGAWNGLQVENNGGITKIGAAVDAGLFPFQIATEKEIDFLIVHHGLFWSPPTPLTGASYEKIKHCIDHNLAVYSAHLPLDCHSEIGNNAILAKRLNLEECDGFLDFEGNKIGLLTDCNFSREDLKTRLQQEFPSGIQSIEFGSKHPTKIGILSGSGQSAVDQILNVGADTLITGELKQQHFNYAQEKGLNLYVCGHYATETFGVEALAKEAAEKFNLPYEFVDTSCPL